MTKSIVAWYLNDPLRTPIRFYKEKKLPLIQFIYTLNLPACIYNETDIQIDEIKHESKCQNIFKNKK